MGQTVVDVYLLLRDVSTIRERRPSIVQDTVPSRPAIAQDTVPSRPAIVQDTVPSRPSVVQDTVPSRPAIVQTVPGQPPSMREVERTMESTTEIEIELDLDPPPLPPLNPFAEDATHILPAAFEEDLRTDQWRRQDHELDDADLIPRVGLRRPSEVSILRRVAAIGGSCLFVLAMAVVLYSVVVRW